MIEPGSTIGILGGGQLGRMTTLAATALGYRCHIFCPIENSPAKLATPFATTAAYDDHVALGHFANAVDVITFEFENIPAETVEFLATRKPMRPSARALRITQDRLEEKNFLRSIGVATAPYRDIASAEDLRSAIAAIGPRAILKTVRMGYDGKGQTSIQADTDLDAIWHGFGATTGILEGFVEFACEISVVVARSENGKWATYTPVENQHLRGILDTTIAPARIAPDTAMRAEAIARHIAERLEIVGVLAVEMFVTPRGEILVNELAPRPHNSGHWTIDACYTSQFEQLVRAICGLPLGSPEHHSDAIMKNLIGADIEKWREAIADPLQKIHLYGKDVASPGRKMGHVTKLIPRR